MKKEILDLNEKIKAKLEEVKNLANTEGKAAEARAAKAELDDMQARLSVQLEIEDKERETVKAEAGEMKPISRPALSSEAIFGAHIRTMLNKFYPDKAMEIARRTGTPLNALTEGTDAKGGYTVPEDISTKVEQLRDARFSMLNLVTVENVSTLSGARTFQTRSAKLGFQSVAEGGATPPIADPTFDRYTYSVVKRSGYMQATDELLEDTDANITQIVMDWLADMSRVTANKLILAALKPTTPTPISDIDDIRDIVNTTLGMTFKSTSTIVTNDFGLNYLDKLKDSNGQQLLQPNYADPTRPYINFIGTLVPIIGVPAKDLPNGGTNSDQVPFIIGDLKEACVYFRRRGFEVETSNTATVNGVSAFENDLVYFKGSEREDVVVRDSAAYVYAELDTSGN